MSLIDPLGRGIREFEYQRNAYLNSLIEADQEDARNYQLDNRWGDVNPVPYIPHDMLTGSQIEALDSLQRYHRRAWSRHVAEWHHCTPTCRFHPIHEGFVNQARARREAAKVARELGKRRRVSDYSDDNLWGNSAPES